MPKDKITLVLTLTVTFSPNGVPVEELGENLTRIVRFGADDGMMTGESPAEVDTWETSIEEV